MHGCLLWSKKIFTPKERNDQDIVEWICAGDYSGLLSNLVTWQDERINESFLKTLPLPNSYQRIYSGFGCATLFWLSRNEPDFVRKFDHCGTIVLNIGTSSQIAFQLKENFTPPKVHPASYGDFMSSQQLSESSITYFPYFNDRYLAVAASLNGGNVIMEFARILSDWISEITGTLGKNPDKSVDPKFNRFPVLNERPPKCVRASRYAEIKF
uniref:Sedoheptulokinase n=1 Tax=Romanomermis culicivorax TaxID=13658 RepID=A0A915JSK5_ROMCU